MQRTSWKPMSHHAVFRPLELVVEYKNPHFPGLRSLLKLVSCLEARSANLISYRISAGALYQSTTYQTLAFLQYVD